MEGANNHILNSVETTEKYLTDNGISFKVSYHDCGLNNVYRP